MQGLGVCMFFSARVLLLDLQWVLPKAHHAQCTRSPVTRGPPAASLQNRLRGLAGC
jgi:hypothetical protein